MDIDDCEDKRLFKLREQQLFQISYNVVEIYKEKQSQASFDN